METDHPIKQIVWIRWRDASHGLDEWRVDRMALSELEEVGFILKEDEDSITLGMEQGADQDTARLWLTIPKNSIIERREAELEKAFPVRKRKAK